MPLYKLNRTTTLRTTAGCSFEIVKNEPFNAPLIVEQEIIALGGERVDGTPKSFHDDTPDVVPQISGEERQAKILRAINDIVKRNDAKEFTAQGTPSLRAVARITRLQELDRSEIDDVWRELRKHA